jgi:NAD+ dependent glucose-6-phosphate dehydrogenase
VAITGARGMVGARLADTLATDLDVVRLHRGNADLLDRTALTTALTGCEAVVHLAAGVLRAGTWDEVWDANLLGLRNLFDAACAAGCRRVIFGSSLHVLGMYEEEGRPHIYAETGGPYLGTEVPPRPANPYAVTKAAGEIMARYYSDVGRLRVACIRIGTMNAADSPHDPAVRTSTRLANIPLEERYARLRAKWLSHADFARLVRAILSSDLAFAIVYGVSDNPGRFVDLEAGRRLFGFWPSDSSGSGDAR